MFLKVLIVNIICFIGVYAVDAGYYSSQRVGDVDIYFPKSDTEYVDYLTQKEGPEASYELALAHIKLGKKDIAERYIKEYKKYDEDPKKLIRYYRLAGNYPQIEKYLDILLEESDRDESLRYRILVSEEAEAKGLPLDVEKYRVSKLEKLYFYRRNEEEFKRYFNSEKWTRTEMNEFIGMLRDEEIEEGSSVEKIYNMFATEREHLQRKYSEIRGLGDTRGYEDYFSYAEKMGVEPEIKDEIEALYYLRYRKQTGEVKLYEEKLARKYIDEERSERAGILYKTYETPELEAYLFERDESSAYRTFRREESYKTGMAFLERYPQGIYSQNVYERIFEGASHEEKLQLIEVYGGDYKVSKDYLLKSYSGDEKRQFIKGELLKGNLDYLKDYVEIFKRMDGEGLEDELKGISREAYAAYLIQEGRPVLERDKAIAAQYLYEEGKLRELQSYTEYLSKENLAELSRRSSYFRDYYRGKYPLEEGNIDSVKGEYFYFSDRPETSMRTVEELIQKRHLEPQERYYLAVYYHNKGDYVRSFRESEQLYRRYQLSDRIFQLHTANIEKIKEGSTNG